MAAQNERIAGARLGITLGVILLWFGFAWSAEAALVKLDFEDLGPGTVVTNQYGDRGIVFSNHVIGQSPTAHSGTHVLLSAKPSDRSSRAYPSRFPSTRRKGGSAYLLPHQAYRSLER